MRDLLDDPVWREAELGLPIPDSPHAVSCALPTWQSVLGYEEHDPAVWEHIRCGYPRFVIHPRIQELALEMGKGRPALPFSSREAAAACANYLERKEGRAGEVVRHAGVWGVIGFLSGIDSMRAFWQHTGLLISSRHAEAALADRAESSTDPAADLGLREQLAEFYGCDADDVFLHPSGMASIYDAFRVTAGRNPERGTVQVGFPYVDTLKLQQELGAGVLFHESVSGSSLDDLEKRLSENAFAACFCEIPGNPMLGCPDLDRLADLLRRHDVPLVVDDTVATPFNVDLGAHADLVTTSLTKFISGTGDVMGGALVCNPRSRYYDVFKGWLAQHHVDHLWHEDAARIGELVAGFPKRMEQHNAGGLILAERLREHPAIERVWYPKWEDAEAYESVRRPGAGWGGLISFLPRNAAEWAPMLYDHLAYCKGPSLGTVYTLACPFTLLAHYKELDWAESCGVSRNMIRISVGLEDPEVLWSRMETALNTLC